MAVKVTYQYRFDGTGRKGYGPSESFYYVATPANLADLAPQVVGLADARVQLNAGNVTLTQARISRIEQVGQKMVGRRRVLTLFSSVDPKLNRFGLPANGSLFDTLSANHPNGCIDVQTQAAAEEAVRGHLFLSGVPDALLGTDPPGPKLDDVPGWWDAFQVFRSQLINDLWAFRGRIPTAAPFPAEITAWMNEVGGTGRLQFTLPDTEDAGDVRDIVQVRGVRMLSPLFERPNGQYRIAARSSTGGITTYTLKSTEGLVAEQIDDNGTVEPVQYALWEYGSVEIAGETTRKRGVGSVRPRGRSSVRRRRLA